MKQRLAPRMPLAQLNSYTTEHDADASAASADTAAALAPSPLVASALPAVDIEVALIDPSPYQPRINFAPDAIDLLAASIEADGLWVPINVRQLPNGRYQLVGGERRLRAHQTLDKKTIRAHIVDPLSEFDAAVAALGDNEARTDLCDYERGKAFRRLLDMPPPPGQARLTQVTLAKRIAKSEATISRCLSFFNLPADALALLDQQPDLIGAKNAMTLAGLAKKGFEDIVMQALKRIKEDGVSEQGAVSWAVAEANKRTRSPVTAVPIHLHGRHVADIVTDGMKLIITCKAGTTPHDLIAHLQQLGAPRDDADAGTLQAAV